jgi:hypothetical protein
VNIAVTGPYSGERRWPRRSQQPDTWSEVVNATSLHRREARKPPQKGVRIKLLSKSDRVPRLAAVLAAIGFIALALFQAALAAGAPWGEAAWGGGDSHLSAVQRGASVVAAVIYVAAALIVLGRAGIWGTQRHGILYRWGTWFIAVAMAIGALPNLISQSRWENLIFGPLALVSAVLCVCGCTQLGSRAGAGTSPRRGAVRAGHRSPPSKTWAGRARPRRSTGLLLNSIQA